MRVMMIVKASEQSEAGVMPSTKMFAEMGRFNEELQKAGVLLDAAGLKPSSKGARVMLKDGKRTVVDGPFAEVKELIAGFWVLDLKSKEEAIEWALRAPDPHEGEWTIEIRPFFEPEDFDNLPDDVRAMEVELRERAGKGQ